MKKKVFIEWSRLFENDIMGLVRNDSNFLSMDDCIFSYVDAEQEPADDIPRPLYVDYLYDNLYYGSIKDKLIENLGRSEIQEISNHGNWSLSIMVARVFTEDNQPVGESIMKSLCGQLVKEHDAMAGSMAFENVAEIPSPEVEIVHITENLQNDMVRKAV